MTKRAESKNRRTSLNTKSSSYRGHVRGVSDFRMTLVGEARNITGFS